MNDTKTEKRVPLITKEYAESVWNKVEVVCPEDDNLKPKFKLRNIDDCPMKLDGGCSECTFFMVVASEEGSFWAHGVYDGYCDTKNKKNKD